jgi:hypothetical protein
MPFLSLCCASSPHSKRSEAEAETRRARIVPILDPSEYRHSDYLPQRHPSYRTYSSESNDLPPPRYEDVTTSFPVFVVDEKDRAGQPPYHAEPVPASEGNGASQNTITNAPSHPQILLTQNITGNEETSSDRSSIISIPSTQITGLGSSYTGTTTLRGDLTGRNSQESSARNTFVDTSDEPERDVGTGRGDSRPPSYDACASRRRADSPASGSEGDSVFRHPVMREGWLEGLGFGRRGARRDRY